MQIATVIGHVWASKKLDCMPNGALLIVETENSQRLVALDLMGCGEGEKVLVASDNAVIVATHGKPSAIDLIVVAVLDS